jgi:hypothetical protein
MAAVLPGKDRGEAPCQPLNLPEIFNQTQVERFFFQETSVVIATFAGMTRDCRWNRSD